MEGIIHKDHGIGVHILEKKMETAIIRGSIGLYRGNGKEHGNYYYKAPYLGKLPSSD